MKEKIECIHIFFAKGTNISGKGKRKRQHQEEDSDMESLNDISSSPLRLVWTLVTHDRINGVLDNLKYNFRVEQAIVQGDLWKPSDAFSDPPRLILLGYCRAHQGQVRGELYSGYVSCSLEPLKARNIFDPDGDRDNEEYNSDSSSSLSYETLSTSSSDIPGRSKVVLRVSSF